jgi:hypothetical protein
VRKERPRVCVKKEEKYTENKKFVFPKLSKENMYLEVHFFSLQEAQNKKKKLKELEMFVIKRKASMLANHRIGEAKITHTKIQKNKKKNLVFLQGRKNVDRQLFCAGVHRFFGLFRLPAGIFLGH